jgi:hypothetical protein
MLCAPLWHAKELPLAGCELGNDLMGIRQVEAHVVANFR